MKLIVAANKIKFSILLSFKNLKFLMTKTRNRKPTTNTVKNPIIPNSTTKVLDALKIDIKLRNYSFIDGKNILPKNISLGKLNILFKKVN